MATNPNTFNQPPYNVPMISQNGFLTDPWNKWFQQLWLRVGGATSAPIANIINTTPSNLISALAPAAVGSMYTSPAGFKTIINSLQVENIDIVSHTISIYLVPTGAFPTTANIAVSSLSIAAGQTLTIGALQFQVLNAGGMIQVVADTANILNIISTGWVTL